MPKNQYKLHVINNYSCKLWVPDDSDYDVDPQRADSFYAEVRKYWPGLKDGSLVPDYSGIRPKIQAPGEASKDFVISGPEDHGSEIPK